MSQSPPNTTPILCHSPGGTAHPVPIAYLQWRPASYAITIHNRQILLLKQFSHKYDLPGGGINMDEHPPAAALRETYEETGLTVHRPRLLGVESSFFKASHSDGGCFHSLLFYYACELVGGEKKTWSGGLDEWEKTYVEGAEWVDVARLEELEVGSTVDWRSYVRMALARGQDEGNIE